MASVPFKVPPGAAAGPGPGGSSHSASAAPVSHSAATKPAEEPEPTSGVPAEPYTATYAIGLQQAEIEDLQRRLKQMTEAHAAAEMRWMASVHDVQLSIGRNNALRRELAATKGKTKGGAQGGLGRTGLDETRMGDFALWRLYHSGFICQACNGPSYGDEV